MGKGVLQVASWMMAGVLLLTGCGGGLESNNKKGEAKKADKVSETIEDSTNKTYTSNFKAQGEKADLYNQNLENFQQEFLEYYKGTNELDKVRGYQEPIEVNTINWYTAAVEEAMGNFGKKYGDVRAVWRGGDPVRGRRGRWRPRRLRWWSKHMRIPTTPP